MLQEQLHQDIKVASRSLLDAGRAQPFPEGVRRCFSLQIELHLRPDTCSNATAALDTMVSLEAAGLRAFSSEYNFEWPFAESSSPMGLIEYSFVNVRECGVVSPM